ncbi:hypothetical protein [Thermoflavimicrobium dichotomicum]|uniref:Uncharacterized protein n=1 Tax=Thermoflavimicrobium dichotomicum TaxID=46223 RepID=A0A1I3RXS9_9BACL|nr:hypothetical protein [Thermoflavimicrobium dichotomicum]SFJ51225.1 hypothetical protein SAMN05421852_11177 [Thermoflavimicrobium dichotomicum]
MADENKEYYQAKNVWNMNQVSDLMIAQDEAQIFIGEKKSNIIIRQDLKEYINQLEQVLNQLGPGLSQQQQQEKERMVQAIPAVKRELDKTQPDRGTMNQFSDDLRQSSLVKVSSVAGIASAIIALIDLVTK